MLDRIRPHNPNRQRIRCVIRLGNTFQAKEFLHRLLNLFFFCPSPSGNPLFNLIRREFDDRNARVRNRKQNYPTGHTHPYCAGDICLKKEVFNRHGVRLKMRDSFLYRVSHLLQALHKVIRFFGLQTAVIHP